MVVILDTITEGIRKMPDNYDLWEQHDAEQEEWFGDITYNEEEDRKRWWQYVTNGKVPFWMYLVKFEGYSEEDAKAIGEEMKADSESKLFGEE